MSVDKKLFFLHIPKTAGTSLRKLIKKEYPGKACLYLYYPAPFQPAVIKEIHANLPAAKVLYGHFSFGIHQLLGIQGHYVAFLRNPIERVISFYNHNARQSDTPYYAAIQEGLSLLDMLQSERIPETNNHVTRIIACCGLPGMLDDTRVLEQALDNIEKHFCFVGLVERFAESVNLLGKKLGWKSSHTIPYLNVDTTKPLHQIDAQTQAALEKYNRLDMLLYEHVNQRYIMKYSL
ncbi:MAG: hypothetical protein DRR08_26700 [Candidatus Parabeggiatoa sp. nov. 2]|nr:MAG: hypothetical protein DRR08_26700 [Gammaproteobacteria bacterium]HEC84763.1 hypothetical protein [Thioploca sp.]